MFEDRESGVSANPSKEPSDSIDPRTRKELSDRNHSWIIMRSLRKIGLVKVVAVPIIAESKHSEKAENDPKYMTF